MAKKQHSFEEVEDVILQSYTGNPHLEKDFPLNVTRSGTISIEGITFNYQTVRRTNLNPSNNSYFYFDIDL